MLNKFKIQLETAKSKAASSYEQGREKFSKTYDDISSQAKERLNTEVPKELEAWCSWCGNHTNHSLIVVRKIGRDSYQCSGCSFPTSICRYCDNMAKSASFGPETNTEKSGDEGNKVSDFFANNWTNEFCSEHDGSIPDFSRAHEKLACLSEFDDLMTPKQKNLYGLAKRSAAIAGGVAAVGTGAVLAAPGIAAAMGTAGALGAAGTGTAISSLSGAALTSAAVAKIGVGGLAIITATGAGLGGKAGFGIANAYFKDIPDFKFIPLRENDSKESSHTVVVINGFLTEDDTDAEDWSEALNGYYDQKPVWLANWEAKTLLKLGSFITSAGSSILSRGTLKAGVKVGSKKFAESVAKGGWALTAAQLASNPWHSAMLNAEKVGALLAEAISRTEGQTFTIIGHSLGARVAYYALQALATKDAQFVEDAILMGAAVGAGDVAEWKSATHAVKGNITNCYSTNDQVLNILYKAANAGLSSPAGREAVPGINNLDCTDFIEGHNTWKENLSRVLDRIETSKQNA
jgi:hypothetical protein